MRAPVQLPAARGGPSVDVQASQPAALGHSERGPSEPAAALAPPGAPPTELLTVLHDQTPSAPTPSSELLVDPAVSAAKFARELAVVRARGADLRRRGWWILDATFPNVIVAFASATVQPRSVVFGARLNFDNYDLWAPSVRIVDPFTDTPLRTRELPPTMTFLRRLQGPEFTAPDGSVLHTIQDQPLLITHGPDELPFFCIPGVREYHEHPAHSGDHWFLHRQRGEGTMYFLLEKLARYGLEPIRGLQFQIKFSGYASQPVAE